MGVEIALVTPIFFKVACISATSSFILMFSFCSIMPNALWKENSKTTIDTNPKSWFRAGGM
jgi:hypothetical protein